MDGAESLIQMGQQARLIENITTHKSARKLAGLAVKHATSGLMSHADGNFGGAAAHAAQAAAHLKDAARLHVSTIGGETPSAQILDAAHLGGAQQLQQKYLDSVNEGKKNGR